MKLPGMLRNYVALVIRAPGDRRRLLGLLALLTGAAGFEALGVGLVMPFIALIERPSLARESRVLRSLASAVGLQTPNGLILLCGVLLLTVFVVKNVYLALVHHLQMRFIYGRMAMLARDLMWAYLRQPYAFHLQRNSSDLVRNVVMNTSAVFHSAVPSLLTMTVEGLTVSVITVLLVTLEPVVVPTIAVLMGGGGYVLHRLYRRRVTELGLRLREEQGRMLQQAHQAFGGVKEARVLGCEEYLLNTFTAECRQFSDGMRTQREMIYFPRYALETLGVTGLVFATVTVLIRSGDSRRLVPLLGVLALAVVRLMPSATRMLGSLSEIRYYGPTVAALNADLTAAPDPVFSATSNGDARPLPFSQHIKLTDVSYTYAEAPRPALQSVTLTIQKGEAIALVGPSGAGKTTLVDVLVGLLAPTTGTIEVDGQRLDAAMWRRWQRRIGYIPQQVYLCDDTLRRNIAFGRPDAEIDPARLQRALEAACLSELVGTLPEGLETLVGERGVRLSGGQRQRVGIARALYLDPQVLVLDEATAALDNATEHEVVEALEAARTGRTLIVIAHRLSTVRRCDRLVYMAGGRVVQVGSWDALLAGSVEFRNLVSLAVF